VCPISVASGTVDNQTQKDLIILSWKMHTMPMNLLWTNVALMP